MENMDTVAQPSRAAISLWPDELLDAVFRTVDYKTFDGCVLLRTCSLVCRRWRPLAQHYTFRYLCLRLILKDRSLTAFYRFLNASPHICSHVRDLAILSWNFRIILTIDLRFLRRLLLLLPRLESFSLDNYRLECNGQLPNSPFPTTVDPRQLFSTEITHGSLPNHPLATTLELKQLSLTDITATGLPFYDGFLALLRLFPAVDVLKLGSIRPARLASILDEDITHGAPYPPIKRLAVEVTSDLGFWEGGKLAEILAPSNNLNTLRAVELECRSLHGLVGCNAILSQLPRALDELEISVYLSPSSLANNETLENLTTRLSTFTSLHCFAFGGYPKYCNSAVTALQCLTTIAAVLSSVPANLAHVKFEVRNVLLYEVSWESIRAACRRFRDIVSITVYMAGVGDVEALCGEMAEFAERGILYIDYGPLECSQLRREASDLARRGAMYVDNDPYETLRFPPAM